MALFSRVAQVTRQHGVLGMCRAFATAPTKTVGTAPTKTGGKPTEITEDMLIKWPSEWDKWGTLLHGEQLEMFVSFRSAFMQAIQKQQELADMPYKPIDWSKYEGRISPSIIEAMKKRRAEVMAEPVLDPKEEAARKARIKELLDQMEQACANINRLAKKRIAEIDAEIAQLKAQDALIETATINEMMAMNPKIAKQIDDEIMEGKWYH